MLTLAALSTGHKIGLAIVAAVFIGFALSASFLAPRRWPEFPGRNALSVFILACVTIFVGMLFAVYFFGKETEEGAKAAEAKAGSQTARTVDVTEKEWAVKLPPLKELGPGSYTFVVHNVGKVAHDLAIQGGQVTGPPKTPLLAPGKSGKLTVSLGRGSYTLYCSVPGHRQLGMQARISVG